MTTNPFPVPIYLLRTQPDLDRPWVSEFSAGYWSPETEGEYSEPMSQADWYATLNGYSDHVIYSEGDVYYAFDMAEAQRDAEARWTRARAHAQELAWELAVEVDETHAAFLAGVR